MTAKRIAGYALIALPFAVAFSLDVASHGLWLALAKILILSAVFISMAIGIKWATE